MSQFDQTNQVTGFAGQKCLKSAGNIALCTRYYKYTDKKIWDEVIVSYCKKEENKEKCLR